MDASDSAEWSIWSIAATLSSGGCLWLCSRMALGQGTGDVVGLAAAAALVLWGVTLRVRAGMSVGRAFASGVLALAPLVFLASGATQSEWLHGRASGGALQGMLPGVLAAVAAGCVLVRRVAVDDTSALASWAAGPVLLVPLALETLLTRGPSWRLLGPGGSMLALLVAGGWAGLQPSSKQRPALALAGIAFLVLVPAVAIGVHEHAYSFEDWPCSSLNRHLRLQPWTRVLLTAASIGLLARAGARWARGGERGFAIALSAAAVLVQVPAGYQVTRSGCDGALIETASVLLPDRVLDQGCRGSEACYCGLTYDGLGRPSLLRRSAGPVQLRVPTFLIEGERSALEHLLVDQEAARLPKDRCLR